MLLAAKFGVRPTAKMGRNGSKLTAERFSGQEWVIPSKNAESRLNRILLRNTRNHSQNPKNHIFGFVRTSRKPSVYTPCGYCFDNWATCYDHIKPLNSGGDNTQANLYPACQRCNGWLGARVFSSLDEKRAYVNGKLAKLEERKRKREAKKQELERRESQYGLDT